MITEYVYQEQKSGEKDGFTLPFSPPFTNIFNVKYQGKNLHFLTNPYFTVDYKIVARQERIVPPEEITPGYSVINVGLGCEVEFSNQSILISFQVQNLLNDKFFNHTSFYRLINVPEPGRNFILNISIPFIQLKPNRNEN
jgi:iron complex outermembrane receptor protein